MATINTRVWPEQMLDLARSFGGAEGERARAEFWILLNLALAQRLRLVSRRYGPIDPDRNQDLASEKALDLIRRLDCGQWNPENSSPGELVNFLSTVARNALVDELRREAHTRPGSHGTGDVMGRAERACTDATGHAVDRKEFVAQLVDCARGLKPGHRVVWLLRVLHELPTLSIATHPEVQLKPGHVDVILDRCRRQIRECMARHGYHVRELPPGTFAELWWRFRASHSRTEGLDD